MSLDDIGAWPIRVTAPPPTTLPGKAGAVVVGGGIIGLLTAIELRRRGRHVLLLEAANLGAAQSGRSMGFAREQGREAIETKAMRLANAGWRHLASTSGVDMGWTQGGHLSIAPTEEKLEQVTSWGHLAEGAGIPFELLVGNRLREHFPWIGPSVAGAGYTPEDGHVDPRRAIRGVTRLARDAGVEIAEGAPVDRLVVQDGRVVGVEVRNSVIYTDLVAVAAGVWSGRLLRSAGVRVPLHAGRGTLGVTKPAPFITRASVWDMGGVGFRQSPDGRIVFGLAAFVDVDVRWEDVRSTLKLLPTLWESRKTMRLHVGRPLFSDALDVVAGRPLRAFTHAEPAANDAFVNKALTLLAELVPQLSQLEVEATWGGVIDSTPDFLPIVDKSEVDGLLLGVGTSGHGLGLAPAIAAGVAETAESGVVPDYLAGFSLSRFQRD